MAHKEGATLYITPSEAEFISCLINKARNDLLTITSDEADFASVVADYFSGIKAYARLTAERMN